jgi:YidC/Oxa1 family membrane protein insertase
MTQLSQLINQTLNNNFMGELFNVVLYQPLLNLLVFFYNIIPGHDVGLAIIAMTILLRLILYPLSIKSIKSQKAMKDLQPKLDEIKKKFANQKEKIASETMALYKSEKINPFSSCLPLLIQLPFLIAVYRVFRQGLASGSLDMLYPFIHNPGVLSPLSMGLFDLSKPVIVFALLAGVAQFFQSKMLVSQRPPKVVADKPGAKDEDMSAIMNKQMTYMMPVITVVIGWTLPGGLTLYWFMSTLLMFVQQVIIFKQADKDKELPKVEVVS